MTDWRAVRARFPAVERCAYLNTAAGAPISVAAADAGADYYRASRDDGDVHWDAWLARVETVRARVATLLDAGAEDVAFVNNASAGLNLAARMLAGAGEVLLVEDDFPSVTWPWMQHGFGVRFARTGDDGGATIGALEEAWTPAVGILAVGLVQYRTGYRYDLDEIVRWCRNRKVALVVDATQALGAVHVDVRGGDVDFLVSSGYKWLTAGYGVGVLYVSPTRRDPARYASVGWRSARDPYALEAGALDVAEAAAVLEAGHPPFPGVFSLGAALEIHDSVGTGAIEARTMALADRVREGLEGLGIAHRSAVSAAHRSPIVAAAVAEPTATKAALEAAGVLVSARGDSLRISTHLYNLESDVDALIEALPACGRPT